MQRKVEPEWLDEMPPTEALAAGSRRDLQRLNRLMGHAAVLSRIMQDHGRGRKDLRLVELGAGDGTFLLRVAQRLPRTLAVRATLVDRLPLVTPATQVAFQELGWQIQPVIADVFAWLRENSLPSVITTNLFLHHFTGEPLAELLHRIAERAELFCACEPKRAPLAWLASRCLRLVGCNTVTRHDAVVSVRAGFNENELSALWPRPRPEGWRLEERPTGLFSHLFVARRG
jgi:hypothetical protein